MASDPKSGLDRAHLRAGLLDLVRLVALWESGALARGRAETRAADERLLNAVVQAIHEHVIRLWSGGRGTNLDPRSTPTPSPPPPVPLRGAGDQTTPFIAAGRERGAELLEDVFVDRPVEPARRP